MGQCPGRLTRLEGRLAGPTLGSVNPVMHRSSPRRTLRAVTTGVAAALALLLFASTPSVASVAADGAAFAQESDEAPSSGAVVPSEPTIIGRDLTASYVVAALVVGAVVVLFVAQRRRTQPPEPD